VAVRFFRPADLQRGVRLASMGRYLPSHEVTNAQLIAEGAPLTEAEILQLCGIATRRRAAPDEATSDLAAHACRHALARAGRTAAEVDRLVLATVSPDYVSPSTACSVQTALGLSQVPAYDLTAACSGFLFALDAAARALCTGDHLVLAAAAEIRSRFVNPTDRATCALFGDGAAAAVVVEGPVGKGLLALGLASDGTGVRSVYVPAGGTREPASEKTVREGRHLIHMQDGPLVYLHAVEGMIDTAEALLKDSKLTWADVDLVVPHQPNRRLIDRLVRLARLDPEKVFINVDRLGNTAGAACPLALEEAISSGRAGEGARVLLVAAGAGYTAGAALLEVDGHLARACQPSPLRSAP
jgi:3-oxoacyl-[acyl-carrier-protein] synthase III